MANHTFPIRALLACGVLAGPLYVTVTIAEVLTRDGFDLRQHCFTYLTIGDIGKQQVMADIQAWIDAHLEVITF